MTTTFKTRFKIAVAVLITFFAMSFIWEHETARRIKITKETIIGPKCESPRPTLDVYYIDLDSSKSMERCGELGGTLEFDVEKFLNRKFNQITQYSRFYEPDYYPTCELNGYSHKLKIDRLTGRQLDIAKAIGQENYNEN